MEFSYILEQSPRNWETTMRQNIVQTYFDTKNKKKSICVENCQNVTLMFGCSPNAERRSAKLGKLWDRFVP